MIYFEAPYLVIEWDETLKAVVMSWKGFAESKVFRSGLDKALELFETKNTNRWLSDLRGLRAVSPTDQDWLNNDWLTRCQKAGLRYTAVVLPTDIIAQMGTNRVNQRIDKTVFENGYFNNVEEARTWLKSMPLPINQKVGPGR